MKKIFYYLLIIVGYIFVFFNLDKINTLALGSFDNNIGSIPIKMDIDYYDNVNVGTIESVLVKPNCINIDINSTNDLVHIYGSCSNNGGIEFNPIVNLKPNTQYTIKIFNQSGFINTPIYLWDYTNVVSYGGPNLNDFNSYYVFTTPSNVSNNVRFNIYYNTSLGNLDISFNIMLIEGNVIPDNYSSPFKFGYNASLSYVNNNNLTNGGIEYYFNDDIYSVNINSITSGYLFENLYLPYSIDSNGYISFPAINFGINSIANGDSNGDFSLMLELFPVFNAYYKGEPTNFIYTSFNYTSNDLFFSGVNFSGCKLTSCSNSINGGDLNIIPVKAFVVTELNDSGLNTSINISTFNNDTISIKNYFDYNNFLYVGFRIGDLAQSYDFMNNRKYTFGISSISSRIVDNNSTSSPLPNNPNTIDKYKECNAWYDIPCQLGNAVTYVIYEAPIISPIINFFDSFIDVIQSIVTYFTWFEGLGIIFSVFITILFIRMIILLVKGGNED